MVKINSCLIHGVIVGSCPEMALQTGQLLSHTWWLYAHSKYDFIEAKWEYAWHMSHNGAQLVHLGRICGVTEVYVLIVYGFCVLVYHSVMYIHYVFIVSMSECIHLWLIKVASVIHHISGWNGDFVKDIKKEGCSEMFKHAKCFLKAIINVDSCLWIHLRHWHRKYFFIGEGSFRVQ